MNRRGDLPTLLLIVAALVLYGATLFSFVSFNDNFEKGSEGRARILSDIAFYEDYIIAETGIIAREIISEAGAIRSDEGLREKFRELASKRNSEIKGMENYFGKILRREFSFSRDADKYTFEMMNLNLEASAGADYIKRNVNFRIEFDYSGDVIIAREQNN